MKIQQHLVSYNNWLNSEEDLLNRYFDLGSFKSVETKLVKEMHNKPKLFKDNFLEIGVDDNDDKICLYNGEGKHNGSIYLFGWLCFNERYSYDREGNEVEYFQDDVYGYIPLAKNFNDFLEMLYCNGAKS